MNLLASVQFLTEAENRFLAAVQFHPRQKTGFWPRFNFNRGKKQFLAAVQFQPRPNVTAIMAFLKY